VVAPDDHRELPLHREAVPVLDHLRDLVRRVDVHQREWHVAKKGLARQPQEYRAVFADRPEHAQLLEGGIRLSHDVDAARLELVEMIGHANGPGSRRWTSASTCATAVSIGTQLVSITTSGAVGGSYGSLIPVKLEISPRRALA